MIKLACLGGRKVRNKLFPSQKTIGKEEIKAVTEVMKTKILSGHRGNFTENFWGGKQIRALQKEFAEKFNPNYKALAVNSCTSGLQIACGAIGLKPGDEVIVTPWSMSCSATAPMLYGATPVFCDLEDEHFCIDPDKIEALITRNTKAIIVVDLFGHIYDYEKINKIALKHHLYVIEDAAQAIGAKKNGRYAGTFGHIGCFSFTQGKHLTSGEGGMILTDDPELYMKCALIRNHSEAVINDMQNHPPYDITNWEDFLLPGSNLRMTEIQAAIIREQLKKLDNYVEYRKINAKKLKDRIGSIPGIKPEESKCDNSYYVLSFHYDENKIGIPRNKFIEAVKAELDFEEGRIDRGIPIVNGYIKPLYHFPIFKNYGFNSDDYPVTERLQNKELFITLYHGLDLSDDDIEDIYISFYKVYNQRFSIK